MRNGKWEDYELDFIKQNYKDMTYKEMADILDRTKTAVDLKVNRLGLTKSKYIYEKDFFKEINTEEKAYWLGFIFADGCVSYDPLSKSAELCIKLQGRDIVHLKKFNKSINGNVEVKSFIEVCNLNGKKYDACSIRFYSNELVLDLMGLGVVPNKSLVSKFPQIREDLISHFIRGYFDGDGCICLDNKRKHPKADFTSGSLEFLLSLREELYKNNINSYYCKEKDINTYRLYIRGMKNFDNFFNYIYEKSTIYLDRKIHIKNKLYDEYNVAQRLLL